MYTFNITCLVSILQPSMCCFCISNFEQITYWDGIGDMMDKHPQQPSPQGVCVCNSPDFMVYCAQGLYISYQTMLVSLGLEPSLRAGSLYVCGIMSPGSLYLGISHMTSLGAEQPTKRGGCGGKAPFLCLLGLEAQRKSNGKKLSLHYK